MSFLKIEGKKKYYIAYSIIFLVLFILCWYIYLFQNNKAFFRSFDGFDQHYISFLYIGRWTRQIIRGLFINHKVQIPLWNPSIGYGADIPTSLTAYFYDPFNWISVFIPEVYAEYGYDLMIFLKFYTCGIAYSYFALHRNHDYYSALIGAIIYTFSAVSFVGFYQSFFINPLYIFPVLITGTDELFENNRPVLYVVALAWSFANYFYFAYMMSILVFVYCITKLMFHAEYRNSFKEVLFMVFRFLRYSILSAGLAAVALVPTLLVMIQAGRLGVEQYIPTWFHKWYYGSLFTGFVTGRNLLGRDCLIGFGFLALICVFVLFTSVPGKRQIKFEFIAATVALCSPYIGHLMNGFSYTASRWIWAYALIVSYIVTITIPYLKIINPKQSAVLTLMTVVYILLGLEYFETRSYMFRASSFMLLLFSLLSFSFLNMKERFYKTLICIAASVSVFMMSMFEYSKDYTNSFVLHTDRGTAYYQMKGYGGLPLLDEINTNDGTRFSRYGIGSIFNATWLYDNASGFNFYISIYNEAIDQFHTKLAVNTGPRTYCYDGLGRRSELLSLLGVNHFFVEDDNQKPDEYSELEASKDTYGVNAKSYRPENNRTLFYLFDHSLAEDFFNELSPEERQQALMQCVVLEDEGNINIDDLNLTNDEIEFSAQTVNVPIMEQGVIETDNNHEQIELLFDEISDAELYLYFEGLNYENGEGTDYGIDINGFYGEELKYTAYEFLHGNTIYSHMYGNKHDTLLELECKDSVNRLLINFCDKGKYTYKDIKIYVRKNDLINASMNMLDNNGIHDIEMNINEAKCSVEADRETFLFTSIPYSSGWKVYDNGVKTAPLKADIAFMAVPLEPGKHIIQFKYCTPGLIPGFIISIISGILLYLIHKKTANN